MGNYYLSQTNSSQPFDSNPFNAFPGMWTYNANTDVLSRPDNSYVIGYNLIAQDNTLYFMYEQILSLLKKEENNQTLPTKVLYDRLITSDTGSQYPELILNGVGSITSEGLLINAKTDLVRLNYYYSIGKRSIRYLMRLSSGARVFLTTDTRDTKFLISVADKKLYNMASQLTSVDIPFLDVAHDYIIEMYRLYQVQKVKITDVVTGESVEHSVTHQGSGGYPDTVNDGIGVTHDYYCFGLEQNSAADATLLIKRITTLSDKCDLTLLIYGDSITEPEGYFPTADFPNAWTQLIMNNVDGKALSSGRGETTINQIFTRIVNELPKVKAKYVMVTIGTNGGNTEANLSQLVEYIISQGSIPILNNIPCNESGTQVAVNSVIKTVRQKYGIKGCLFDVATSLNQDGIEVDTTTMWKEDYTGGSIGRVIWHHPNVKGSLLMYTRTLIDIPEIYG